MQRDVTVNAAPTPTATPVAPRIATFQLTRNDVVHGSPEASDIQLIWLVTGDTTNIEISGPDLPKISNQPAQGSLAIVGTKPTLFVISASNGALIASQTVNLNVTEPTPTPTPLPTATPPPPLANITTFQAESASGNPSDVQLAPSNQGANTTVYTVVAGTSVKMSWVIDGAASVTLGSGSGSSGVGPTGNTLVTVKQPTTYVLTALNSAGAASRRYLQFNAVPQKAPPAVTGVNGVGSSISVTLTWAYASPDKIVGYRVYRATVPSTDYKAIAFEDKLTATVMTYIDPTSPHCGTSYYVVGVYNDVLSNSLKETAKSAPVWYSKPCGP